MDKVAAKLWISRVEPVDGRVDDVAIRARRRPSRNDAVNSVNARKNSKRSNALQDSPRAPSGLAGDPTAAEQAVHKRVVSQFEVCERSRCADGLCLIAACSQTTDRIAASRADRRDG